MSVGVNLFFIVSLVVFLVTIAYIIISQPPVDIPVAAPSSGKPIPDTTYIGQGKCPVSCTCFPKQYGDGSVTTSQTVCAYLDNDEMFACPPDCCTPSCF